MSHDPFYVGEYESIKLESCLDGCKTFEEFESRFPEEFLNEDRRVGNYLQQLLWKYDKDQATVSKSAGLDRSYVGNIVRGKKNNPSRDALIAICLVLGTTFDEVQYLLKYAGHAPLYVRRKRDVIIWFGFMKNKTITDVDTDLFDRGYKTFIKYE